MLLHWVHFVQSQTLPSSLIWIGLKYETLPTICIHIIYIDSVCCCIVFTLVKATQHPHLSFATGLKHGTPPTLLLAVNLNNLK
mmetsp:Transcript_26071/g.33811  ORF Transcript_26071/g.33811 Transcript_26071/m.33811 type:complete len:83 (-) Transcript_26071:1291-1539(-)